MLKFRPLVIVGVVTATMALDQITKAIARATLIDLPAQDYLWGLLRIQFAQNTGAFLSLGAGMDEHMRFLLFTAAVAVFLVGATYVLFKKTQMDQWTTIGLALLVGGGVGNLIDRIFYGHVTDFLNVGLGSLRTGIFNVADMAIVLGVGLLFLASPNRT